MLAVFDVIVAVLVLLSDMQAYAVEQAGMALRVVHDHVVARRKGVDSRHYALVAEIVEEGVLLLLEPGEHLLELLVVACMAGHHAGAHGIGEAPLGGCLGVRLAHLGVVCQAEVVVEAPVQYGNSVESHVGAELSLETGIHVVAVTLLEILAYRAA